MALGDAPDAAIGVSDAVNRNEVRKSKLQDKVTLRHDADDDTNTRVGNVSGF